MTDVAVSVLMAVRNMERWLPATLDSLRGQTRTDFEIVAVDDGSSDGTSEILRTSRDLRLTVIQTDGVGLGTARNLAIEAASAPLLSVLDGDDLWLPNYMERVVGYLDADSDIAIVSPELLIAVDEEITSDRYYADGYPLQWFDEDQLEHLAEMNFLVPLSTFRREVVERVGVYDPTPGAMEDWDLWIRAIQAGFRAAHIAEPCGVYRFRLGSITTDRVKLVRGRMAVLEKLASHDGAVGERARASLAAQQVQLLFAEGKEALRTGDLAAARVAFAALSRRRDVSARQRAASLVVAAVPRAGQAVLARRSTTQSRPLTTREVRKARE